MRHSKLIKFAIFLSLVLYMCLAVYANAAENKPLPETRIIAVIDVARVARESVALQRIQEKLDSLRASYQQEIAKHQRTLKEAETELRADKERLPKGEFADKAEDFQQRVAALQSRVMKRKEALDDTFSSAMNTFQRELIAQVTDYAKAHEIDLILKRSQVYLAGRQLDITDNIIARVNETLPSIDVDLPAAIE